MQSKRTVYVGAEEVRANVAREHWPDWLTASLRSDVLVELRYERPQGGYVVRLPGVAEFTVKRARRKPASDSGVPVLPSAQAGPPRETIRGFHPHAIPKVEARYHVPRSQVWLGSRGKQSGKVHLHVLRGPVSFTARTGRATTITRGGGVSLCRAVGWYERPDEGEERCPRCLLMAERYGIEWPEWAPPDSGAR